MIQSKENTTCLVTKINETAQLLNEICNLFDNELAL